MEEEVGALCVQIGVNPSNDAAGVELCLHLPPRGRAERPCPGTEPPRVETPMNKSEFIDKVAEKAQMSRAAAARAVDAIFDTAGGAVSEAVHGLGELSIPGFGKFSKKTRAPRQGRNPRTGAVIDIPERSTISFTAGKNFREGSPSGRRKAAGAGAAAGA
ncbi:MAG TPA: HU family DNA-binding protein, partial [Longimicrobium sp.]|nr:HU family DNA-binding protein [Longimicrobium sp.]